MKTAQIDSTRTFLGVSSFQALAMFRRGLFYSYLSIYLRHYIGLSVTETTLFATIPMLMNILFQMFVWGPLSDRHQRRRTLIILGEFLAGTGTFFIWYVHRMTDRPTYAGYIIIIGLSIVEIFWSMSNIGWSALISDIYKEKDRNRIQGQLTSIGAGGRIIGVWIGGLLYDGMGMRYSGWGFHQGTLFFIASAVMLLSIIPMLYVPEGGANFKEEKACQTSPPSSEMGTVYFSIFLVSMIFINFGRNSIAVIQTQYLALETGLHIASNELGYIVNMQSFAMALTGVITGWISEKIGDHLSLFVGTVLSILSLLIIGLSMNLSLIYISSFIRGISEVMILASSYAIASILIPPLKRGKFFGYFNATFFLSWGLAATAIAGPIVDLMLKRGYIEAFAYQMSFIAASVLTMIGLVIHIFLLLSQKKKGLD